MCFFVFSLLGILVVHCLFGFLHVFLWFFYVFFCVFTAWNIGCSLSFWVFACVSLVFLCVFLCFHCLEYWLFIVFLGFCMCFFGFFMCFFVFSLLGILVVHCLFGFLHVFLWFCFVFFVFLLCFSPTLSALVLMYVCTYVRTYEIIPC